MGSYAVEHFLRMRVVPSVLIRPGRIALTRMPNLPPLSAMIVAVRWASPASISAATTLALAAAAGLSKPVVYEHWHNSESVAVALLDAYFKAAGEVVDAATLGEYLSLAIDAQFEFHKRDRLSPWGITNGYFETDYLQQAEASAAQQAGLRHER